MHVAKLMVLVMIVLAPVVSGSQPPTIAFHTITNDIDTGAFNRGLVLSELTFKEEPWLTEADMVTWDVSSGHIFLEGDKWSYLGKFDASLSGTGYLSNHFKLFVVLVNGEPCFVGEFHSAVSSMGPRYPAIHDMSLHSSPQDALVMHSRTWEPKLIEALQALGLYRAGLEVKLIDVRLEKNEAHSNFSIEFDIELINRDDGDLLVLNPDLMAPDFNGYRPWLFVEPAGTHKNQISEQMRRPGWQNEFHKEWLVRMPVDGVLRSTLTREIEHLDPGTYKCHLLYPGPRDVGSGDMGFEGARLWYGQIHTHEIEVRVD